MTSFVILSPQSLYPPKWTINLLFKSNTIRKHVTDFKTPSPILLPCRRYKCMAPIPYRDLENSFFHYFWKLPLSNNGGKFWKVFLTPIFAYSLRWRCTVLNKTSHCKHFYSVIFSRLRDWKRFTGTGYRW